MPLDQVELHSLRIFVVFCESMNMSKAALTLKLTQPAVSHQLAVLEKQLGVELVHRETRPMTLTNAGKMLYERSLQHLAQIKTTLQAVYHSEKQVIPTLKLGIVEFFGEISLPLIAPYLKRSVLNLQVETNKSSVLIEKLLSRELDIIISREALQHFSFIQQEVIYNKPLIGIYHAGIKGLSNSKDTLTQLIDREIDYIEYLASIPLGRSMGHYLHTLNYKINGSVSVDSLRSLYTFVSLTPSWGTTLPIFLTSLPESEKSTVVRFNLPDPQLFDTLYLFYRQNEYEDVAKHLVNLLQTQFKTS